MSESQGGERFEVRFTSPLWSGPVVYTGTHSQSFANVLLAHCLATIYLVGTLLTVRYISYHLGTALCCFEKADYDNKRVVAIRVLKIVDPVKRCQSADGLPDIPIEGELLSSTKPGNKWLYNVDDRITSSRPAPARALALLYENERWRAESTHSSDSQ